MIFKKKANNLDSVEAFAMRAGCTCYCGSYCNCDGMSRIDSTVAETDTVNTGNAGDVADSIYN